MDEKLTRGQLIICRKTLHRMRRELSDLRDHYLTISVTIGIVENLIDLREREAENNLKEG